MDVPTVRHEESPGRASGGLFESVRTLLGTLLAMARTRAELLGNELEQEFRRVVGMLVGAMIVLALASLALLFAALTIVASAGETQRVAATALVAMGFVILAVVAYIVTARRGQRTTRLLAATLAELERDLEQLSPRAP
jgi:uncharacterized membrane protein YqjE